MKEPILHTDIFQYYFQFIQERMNIFWNRYEGKDQPWTKDKTFQDFKFTNVYRCLDRVSQYLIKEVIYVDQGKGLKEEDHLIRIILFKIFNKIDTWEAIEKAVGGRLTLQTFDKEKINRALKDKISQGTIFSNAYMMTGALYGGKNNDTFNSKHERYIHMLDKEFIKGGVMSSLLKCKTMEEMYKKLLGLTYVAEFLAYQYSIDLNYSPVFNFSEDSFVKAGVGAVRGIAKVCDLNGMTEEDFIKWTAHHYYGLIDMYDVNPRLLPGREMKLIDFQNCFCETDKLLREKNPAAGGNEMPSRIKNRFTPDHSKISLYFPPKWGNVMGSRIVKIKKK